MNRKLIVKIGIDLCMTVSLLLLMPYSLLGETAHEWIGMAMFLLFIVHHVLNRRWLASMTRGRYTPLRMVQYRNRRFLYIFSVHIGDLL